MSGVRVLVGTRKGAFVLTSDGKRENWDVSGPALRRLGDLSPQGIAGRPEPHLRVAVERLVRAAHPAFERRRQDLGAGRQQVRLRRRAGHAPVVRRHAAPVGVQARLAPRAVADRPRHRLRRRRGRGPVPDRPTAAQTWHELPGLREHGSGSAWQPGAGGLCLHTILLDPANPQRMFIAISAAGAFRTDDGGETWKPINKGLRSAQIPDPTAEVGHCVHRIAMHPSRPKVLFMQKHWDVMRTDNAGESWREVSGNLPTDFGFVIDVHAHEPDTIFVVPIKSDSEHFPRTASCACIAAAAAATSGRR